MTQKIINQKAQLNINQKLLQAQQEIGTITKDKQNPFYKSNYADINNYIEEVKPILNKYGLIILQPLISIEDRTAIKTIIIDTESGEEKKSIAKLPEQADPQKMGSIITYFRRYAIQSMLFLQAEDDDATIVSQGSTIPKRGYREKDGETYKLENEPKRQIQQGVPIVDPDKPF